MSRILVIEDERKLRTAIREGLSEEGFEVVEASDGDEGLRLASGEDVDLVLLDVMLPQRSGLELVAELRRAGRDVPVLFLSARQTVSDRVEGLEHGGDDYLVKPFAFEELLARVRVLLRRGRLSAPLTLRAAGLEMDLLSRRITCGGTAVELSVRESALLEYFLRHPGETLSREVIARDVWGHDDASQTNVIDVYVNYLRKKIGRGGAGPVIEAVRGVGYRMRSNG